MTYLPLEAVCEGEGKGGYSSALRQNRQPEGLGRRWFPFFKLFLAPHPLTLLFRCYIGRRNDVDNYMASHFTSYGEQVHLDMTMGTNNNSPTILNGLYWGFFLKSFFGMME